MQKFKRVAAALLSAGIAVSAMSGCSGGDKKGKDVKTEASTDPTQKGETAPVPIKLFAAFSNLEKNEFNEIFIQKMEKENNVKIEFELPPAANYDERLQLMMVSREYPDAVLFSSHANPVLKNGVDQGVFIPLTKYVKDAPNLMKYTYPETWEATKLKLDEDIYMVPRTTIVRNDGFTVREDWLENVGLTIPADNVVALDEFTEILKRFTENDPDKNGKNDTFGFTPAPPSADGNLIVQIDQAFALTGWQEYNEGPYKYMDPMYSKSNKNFKEALAYTAMLWKKGYINTDWPLLKSNGQLDSLHKGQTGVTAGFAGHVQLRQDSTQKLNPKAKMTYIAGVKGKDGKFLGKTTNPGIYGGWGITTSAANPQKVVQIFDWILSDSVWELAKYGPEGLTYTIQDGKKVPTDKYTTLKQGSWPGSMVRRNNDPSFFIELTVKEEDKKVVEGWLDTALKTVVFTKDKGYKPPISSDPGYIEAEKKRALTVSRIILGDLSVDAYDKALDDWYKGGGEIYVKEINEYIKKIEGK